MSRNIVLQPNGLLCIFDEDTNDFTIINLTKNEMVKHLVDTDQITELAASRAINKAVIKVQRYHLAMDTMASAFTSTDITATTPEQLNKLMSFKHKDKTLLEFGSYTPKPTPDIMAVQWNKNGDHPDDNITLLTNDKGNTFMSEGKIVRYFRHPEVDGLTYCKQCSRQMFEHGFIEAEDAHGSSTYLGQGLKVCPGDFIISEGSHEYTVHSAVDFRDMIDLSQSQDVLISLIKE